MLRKDSQTCTSGFVTFKKEKEKNFTLRLFLFLKKNINQALVVQKLDGAIHLINPYPVEVSGNLPTYPSPKPTFCPKWEVSVNKTKLNTGLGLRQRADLL